MYPSCSKGIFLKARTTFDMLKSQMKQKVKTNHLKVLARAVPRGSAKILNLRIESQTMAHHGLSEFVKWRKFKLNALQSKKQEGISRQSRAMALNEGKLIHKKAGINNPPLWHTLRAPWQALPALRKVAQAFRKKMMT